MGVMSPMPVNLVWRTDVHLSDDTPRSRLDVWSDMVLEKLAHVGKIAARCGAAAVLDGGDFFNIKSPGRNTHSLVRRAMAVHRDYPCPVFANVGNHDCVYGDIAYLHQQPLGVLFESGVFRRLYDNHEAVFVSDGVKVRVVGIPYHGTTYDMGRFAALRRGDEDYLIVVAHLLASPTETTMFDSEDVVRYDFLDQFPVDLYAFGHWHKDQGIVTTPGGKTVVNIGSLTRGSLSQDDLQRVPSVAIIRCEPGGMTVERVAVPHEPANLVFDVEGRDTAILREEMMDQFVDRLKDSLVPVPGGSLRDTVMAMSGIPQVVKESTLLYLEKAERNG